MVLLKSSTEKKLACIIGINYTNSDIPLSGCINDASRIRNFLINVMNYNDEDIIYMTDESKLKPTLKNIQNSLNYIVSRTKSENVQNIWFSYSGHGSYIVDDNNDDVDCIDETIVPLDYIENGMISDDYIYKNFIQNLPRHVSMVSLVDSCHSGTVFDLPYTYRSSDRHVGCCESRKDRHLLANVVKISGCTDPQTSSDAYIDGRYQGAMTNAFFHIVELYNYKITCKHLISEMYRYLHSRGFNQIPCLSMTRLESIGEVIINTTFITPNIKIVIIGDRWCNTETTWNILCKSTNTKLYDTDMKLDCCNESVNIDISLPPGSYILIFNDVYGDGGVTGELIIIERPGKETSVSFEFNDGFKSETHFIIK
jgi:hypothetical protein